MPPRLLVHVEGQTEEEFVDALLGPHLVAKGYGGVSARRVGNARQRHRRCGIKPWPAVKQDIVRHLRGDPACVATTMFDYYGLHKDWPGRIAEANPRSGDNVRAIEAAMLAEVAATMGARFHPRRFVPFLTLHEFEGLLFSECAAFSRGMYRPWAEPALRRIRDQFATPEDIDESPDTAPSKRILKVIPDYQKPLDGPLAALEVGLEAIRRACPHFCSWLEQLESRAA